MVKVHLAHGICPSSVQEYFPWLKSDKSCDGAIIVKINIQLKEDNCIFAYLNLGPNDRVMNTVLAVPTRR